MTKRFFLAREKYKYAGLILLIWVIISAVIAGIVTLGITINTDIKDFRIVMLIFAIIFIPGFWFLFPSLCEEEKKLSLTKAKRFITKGELDKALAEVEAIIEGQPSNKEAQGLLDKLKNKK